MRALQHAEECRLLGGTGVANTLRWRELREWRWLPARQVAAERAGAEAALARLTQTCTEDARRTPDAARAAADAQTLRAPPRSGRPSACPATPADEQRRPAHRDPARYPA
ncbi:MAG: hypothetical protein U1F26_16865 [Lysobacterales bacterium]